MAAEVPRAREPNVLADDQPIEQMNAGELRGHPAADVEGGPNASAAAVPEVGVAAEGKKRKRRNRRRPKEPSAPDAEEGLSEPTPAAAPANEPTVVDPNIAAAAAVPEVAAGTSKRKRGRGRPKEPSAPDAAEGRGEPTPAAAPTPEGPVGRGRLTGAAAGQTTPPTQELGELTVADEDEPVEKGDRLYSPIRLPPTGKQGTVGERRILTSNFFELESKQWTIYKHDVQFEPAEERTFMKKNYFFEHRTQLGGIRDIMFDGSTAFSRRPLCTKKPLELISIRRSDNTPVKITVKRVGTLEPGDYQNVHFFNIVARKVLEVCGFKEIRRNFYDLTQKIPIPEHRLELLPGYIVRINQFERSILMCADSHFRPSRTDTVYQLIQELFDKDRNNFKKNFISQILGCVVTTKYNEKTYKITDVDFDSNPMSIFKIRKEDMTLLDYYKRQYGINIKDTKQPLLLSKTTARQRRAGLQEFVSLVPELCVMTGMTDSMRSNFSLMSAIMRNSATEPGPRMDRTSYLRQRIDNSPRALETFKEWNLKPQTSLVKVEGRVLPKTMIHFGNGTRFESQQRDNFDWSQSIRDKPLTQPISCLNWILVFHDRFRREADLLQKELQLVGKPMGMHFENAKLIEVNGSLYSDSAYPAALDRGLNQYNPALVAVLVPDKSTKRYSAVKRFCIVNKPVPSQVVTTKIVAHKNFKSIATKIAIQINCKLGGLPWIVTFPAPTFNRTVIIGFDVCHDPQDRKRSYGAMVGTTDPTFGRMTTWVKHHMNGQEISPSFGLGVRVIALRYQQNTGFLPEKLVIYRDGVGEGQEETVRQNEIKSIEDNLRDLYSDKLPGITFIIVCKRINARFYDSRRNPPSGTVVDDIVTRPFCFDFYLISQSIRQGTVTPTYYRVIHDTNGFNPNEVQRMTYVASHMYYNYCGPVRVPAVVQCAHKAAFLHSQSVFTEHFSELNHSPFFL